MRKFIVPLLLLACVAIGQEAGTQTPQPTPLDQAFQYVYAQWARAKLDDSENAQGKAALQFLYQNAKSWEMYQQKTKESANAEKTPTPAPGDAAQSAESGGSK